MVQFNTKDNEIMVKIVFYGPGLSGKTTNLQKLHEMMDPSQKTDLFSVNTMEDRTLFFDLLPVDLGYVYGNSIKLQIYTVPGQVHYDSTRRIVLSGADGVIFVADSDRNKLHENVQSINNLYHNLQANRLNIKEVPLVMQYNKRDLAEAMPVETLDQKLNFRHVPSFEAVAVRGDGVLETFVASVKMTVRYIFEKYQLSKNIKNIEGVVNKLEQSIRSKSLESKKVAESRQAPESVDQTFSPRVGRGGKTVLKYTHTIDDDDRSSQDQLLQKALTSNMETARLYSDLKNSQSALIKKNEELSILYKQLEKANSDNLKIRRFLESLVNFAGEAIITFNDLWVIQNWNQAAEEMFGYVRNEVLNQNINVLFAPAQMSELNKVLGFVVSGKVVKGFETNLQTKSQSTIPVNITFSPIKNQNDTIIAFTAIIRDLSFMSTIQDKLLDFQRFESLGLFIPEFLDAVSLSLKQDPNDIEGLITGHKTTRKTKQLKRQLALIRGLADDQPDEGTSNLNQVINDIHLLIAPQLKQKDVNWQTQLNPDIPPLDCPKAVLSHAILNLVSNAFDAIKNQHAPKLTLGTHHANQETIMQIIDNGSGIAIDNLDRMLTPDSQGSDVQALRAKAARKLIAGYGGKMRVDSSPGKGTKVTIRFTSA